MTFTLGQIVAAHKHSSRHREELAASTLAGCFYCRTSYPASEISQWVADGTCALCPRCEIDSVIGDASGLPVGDVAFLNAMYEHWFNTPVVIDGNRAS